jgi:hypothetical protein
MQLMAQPCYVDSKDWLRERGTTTVNQELDVGVGRKPQSLPARTASNSSLAPKSCEGVDDSNPG